MANLTLKGGLLSNKAETSSTYSTSSKRAKGKKDPIFEKHRCKETDYFQSSDNIYPYYPKVLLKDEDDGGESPLLHKKKSKHHYDQPPGMLANLVDWGHRHRSTWNSLGSSTTVVETVFGLEQLKHLDMVLIQEWTNAPEAIIEESPTARYWIFDQDCELQYRGVFEPIKRCERCRCMCTNVLCCLGLCSNYGFSVDILDTSNRLSMKMIYSRDGQVKFPVMGRFEILGYIVINKGRRRSSTVELTIQDDQEVDKVKIVGLKKDWGKTVKLYRIPHGSLKPSDASGKSVYKKMSEKFKDDNRIGSMIKVRTSPALCHTSKLSDWDYNLMIDTETIVVNFPKIFTPEIKACIIVAAFTFDHIKKSRRKSLKLL